MSRTLPTALLALLCLFLGTPASAEPYRAPWWLPGGHLQTIWSALASRPQVEYRRERWDTPDGDFIDLDWVDGPPDAPLVVLFHGLEGSSHGHYALAVMGAVRERGWRGTVVHFRGCSGEQNRLPRAYHSGDAEEIDWILRRIKAENQTQRVYAVGVSLGGNALLKWLGGPGSRTPGIVDRAVAVSAPVDLMAAGDALGRGFNLLYTRRFLHTLKAKALEKAQRYPGLIDAQKVSAATTLREFDDAYTAPLHGFRNTDDYWTRASSKPVLNRIVVPTLLINARNDPFLPATALPTPQEVSPQVTLEFPDGGGHAGFVSKPFPGRLSWLPARVLEFFGSAPAAP